MKTVSKSASEKPTIGGHIALDLLNTVEMANGELVDKFQSDEDVLRWLAENSVADDFKKLKFESGQLLNSACELREVIRQLINVRKDGKAIEVQHINRFMSQGISHLELVKVGNMQFKLERRRELETVDQLLAPIAELAAELLILEDFSVVKRCESEECALWFLDRTKGHKRRWCSMAICGNRHKVSSFRKRQNSE